MIKSNDKYFLLVDSRDFNSLTIELTLSRHVSNTLSLQVNFLHTL